MGHLTNKLNRLTGVVLGLAGGLFGRAEPAPSEQAEPVRGIVISCQTWGQEWGTDAMVEAMQEVKALGANWVQIHPYAAVTREGGLRWRRWSNDPEPPRWLTRPIEEAHRLGLKICITPHVAPWRAGWSWRGDIQFESDDQWDRFFTDYREWITRLADICADADGFTVGSELDQTVEDHEQDWREIIAEVREHINAPLAYAANWPDYQRVPFWDALDVIAVSAYFPVTQHQRVPDSEEIDRAWARIRGEVLAYARTQYRQVVFMELGYDTGLNAARAPWRDGDGREGGRGVAGPVSGPGPASRGNPARRPGGRVFVEVVPRAGTLRELPRQRTPHARSGGPALARCRRHHALNTPLC